MEIEVCVYCNRTEIDWRPIEDEDDEPAYICTVRTDQQLVTGFGRSFVALHRNLLYGLPPHFLRNYSVTSFRRITDNGYP